MADLASRVNAVRAAAQRGAPRQPRQGDPGTVGGGKRRSLRPAGQSPPIVPPAASGAAGPTAAILAPRPGMLPNGPPPGSPWGSPQPNPGTTTPGANVNGMVFGPNTVNGFLPGASGPNIGPPPGTPLPPGTPTSMGPATAPGSAPTPAPPPGVDPAPWLAQYGLTPDHLAQLQALRQGVGAPTGMQTGPRGISTAPGSAPPTLGGLMTAPGSQMRTPLSPGMGRSGSVAY